jgi:hypothetical protein
MGDIHAPSPGLFLIAASSRYLDVLTVGREQCETRFGVAQAISSVFEFSETNYYAAEMGTGLMKQFWAFHLIDPGRLSAIKRQTNEWETELAGLKLHPEPRPLNLDPGYLTLAKLVLASTKDHAHRIYLDDGIYAEVTLSYRGGAWRPFPWTYPDYRRADFHDFFTRCRDLLRPPLGKN